jgi:hypothetical protein
MVDKTFSAPNTRIAKSTSRASHFGFETYIATVNASVSGDTGAMISPSLLRLIKSRICDLFFGNAA